MKCKGSIATDSRNSKSLESLSLIGLTMQFRLYKASFFMPFYIYCLIHLLTMQYWHDETTTGVNVTGQHGSILICPSRVSLRILWGGTKVLRSYIKGDKGRGKGGKSHKVLHSYNLQRGICPLRKRNPAERNPKLPERDPKLYGRNPKLFGKDSKLLKRVHSDSGSSHWSFRWLHSSRVWSQLM